MIQCYKITWTDIEDEHEYTEFFATPEFALEHWATDVSYVHTWQNPEEGLRKYLQHLPLIDVTIKVYD